MFWNDVKIRGLIYQAAVLILVIGAMAYFALNAQQAMEARGITTGLAFLEHASGFAIGEGAIAHGPSDTYLHALLAGAVNTLIVSIAAIVGATIIGLALGIARLSSNHLLSGLARAYVELFRNTPQLLADRDVVPATDAAARTARGALADFWACLSDEPGRECSGSGGRARVCLRRFFWRWFSS